LRPERARHLADPGKLLASAGRCGDMERLWGEVAPVPERTLRPLSGGEELLGFEVAYTPGHASHHVSYLHPTAAGLRRRRRRSGSRPATS
jgi:glyoxylase-like metal-dependent hydrolase (beta-lactamase superfamily II)